MEKVLTIIVPSYNVEQYLEKCVNSMVDAGCNEEIEIILVNDGSTDSTHELAEAYARLYRGTVRVINKQNGGHGSAINAGILAATGTYLRILDGDDWVDSAAFAELVNRLKTATEDVIVTRYNTVQDVTWKVMPEDRFDIYHFVDIDKPYTFGEIADMPYIRIHQLNYRTDLMQKNDITIDEKCFYVDVEFALYPMPFVRTLRFLDLPVYQYRVGRPKQSMNINRMQQYVSDHRLVMTRIFEFYDREKEADTSNALLKYLEYELARLVVTQTRIWLSFPPMTRYRDFIRELGDNVRTNYPKVQAKLQNRAVRFLFRFRCFGYRPISWLVRKRYGVGKQTGSDDK